MNKKNIILFTILFANLFLPVSNAHKKMHDNRLHFTGDFYSVNFTVDKHCVSPGQPFGILDGSQINSGFTGTKNLIITAGRHDSSDTVKCVVNNLFPGSKKATSFDNSFTFDKTPKKLHFAIKGTLNIDGVSFKDIILMQGHTLGSNNWWFGGSNCQKEFSYWRTKDGVSCTATDGSVWCFIRGNYKFLPTSDHRIMVENKKCRK